ncbi:MAG: hypothetical protein ACREYE_13600, partial [Gammaproteobacteria bacterium]
GAGQDGADQARIHPAPREKEGGLTVKLFKGHYTSFHIASTWPFQLVPIALATTSRPPSAAIATHTALPKGCKGTDTSRTLAPNPVKRCTESL